MSSSDITALKRRIYESRVYFNDNFVPMGQEGLGILESLKGLYTSASDDSLFEMVKADFLWTRRDRLINKIERTNISAIFDQEQIKFNTLIHSMVVGGAISYGLLRYFEPEQDFAILEMAYLAAAAKQNTGVYRNGVKIYKLIKYSRLVAAAAIASLGVAIGAEYALNRSLHNRIQQTVGKKTKIVGEPSIWQFGWWKI